MAASAQRAFLSPVPAELAAASTVAQRFARRAVRVIARHGVWRFLAVGDTCYPVVHEALHDFGSDWYRIAYFGHHAHQPPRQGVISVAGDPSDAHLITGNPAIHELLRDEDRPVGILLIGVLEHIATLDHARGFAKMLMDWAPEGSYLAACHALSDGTPRELRLVAAEEGPIIFRSLQQISGFFDGLTILQPGITEVSRWRLSGRATTDPPLLRRAAGVGRKGRQRSGPHAVATGGVR